MGVVGINWCGGGVGVFLVVLEREQCQSGLDCPSTGG